MCGGEDTRSAVKICALGIKLAAARGRKDCLWIKGLEFAQ